MALRVSQEGIIVDANIDPGLEVHQEGIIVDAEPQHIIRASQAGVSVSWYPGEPRQEAVSHGGVSALWDQEEQYLRTSHGGVSPLWEMEKQVLRASHAGVSVLWQTGGYLMLRFSTLGHDDMAAALNVPGVTFDANGNLNVNLNLYVDGNLLQMLQLMLKSTYDTDDNGQVDKADDSDKLGGVAAADYLTEAEHTAIGNGAPHHASFLPTDIDTLAELNAIVADATLDDSSNPRNPNAHATSHKHSGSDEIATATPAAGDIPKLDINGDLELPAGGDVLPDGATDVDHGIDKRLRDVSGPVGVGSYGYNPNQIKVPSSSWYLGVADGSGRDDFFRDNRTPNGTTQWSNVAGFTPYSFTFTAPSIANLWSKYTSDASPNHAILQETISGHTSGDHYGIAMMISETQASNSRIGMVLMDSTRTTGSAWWYIYTHTTLSVNSVYATYSSATDWLLQANMYTTDWTVRFTGAATPIENAVPLYASISQYTAYTYGFVYRQLTSRFIAFAASTPVFTPAYLFLFVEGNLSARKVGKFDFVGRNVFT